MFWIPGSRPSAPNDARNRSWWARHRGLSGSLHFHYLNGMKRFHLDAH